MSSKMSNLAKSFLNDLEHLKETTELLNSILENLEEKNDPSTREIQLASDIYQFFEKMGMLKENMRNYVLEEYHNNNSGSKLSELLDNQGKITINWDE